jgi:Carboxypeptidase regulatory-like domain
MHAALFALTLAALGAAPNPLVPPPPGELRGQVTQGSGAPVTAFTVNGVRFEDPQGCFKILTPPDGEFRVIVRAEGFAPNVFHVQGASGKKLQIPEITLGQGEHVLGEVLAAETGSPVADARVTLADPAKLERLRFVRPERVAPLGTTGEGGWYELRHVPRGPLVLVVSHPDYLPEFVAVNTRERMPTVQLHRGGGISGVVRDARGAPAAGVRVVALSEGAKDAAETSADSAGRFELRRLRAGSYRVVAQAFGRVTDAGEVTVVDGEIADVAVAVRSRQMPSAQLPPAPRHGPLAAR